VTLSQELGPRGAGSNLKVEGHGHYFRREAPEKFFRVPPPFLAGAPFDRGTQRRGGGLDPSLTQKTLKSIAGAPFDRGHQTKVWGTQRFDRYSSDCE